MRNYLRVITHHYKTQFQNFEMLASNVDEIDTPIEYEEIRQSLNREDNARLCRVCLTNVSDTLLLPCRHANSVTQNRTVALSVVNLLRNI